MFEIAKNCDAKTWARCRRNTCHELRTIALLQRTLCTISASVKVWRTATLIRILNNDAGTEFAEQEMSAVCSGSEGRVAVLGQARWAVGLHDCN